MIARDENRSYWSEIRNDYIDESDVSEVFAEMSIDAWRTEEDDEEGKVIAKILAIKTDKKISFE